MRLIGICLPFVLGPLLVAGQQTQPATTQKPAQTSAVKHASSHKTASHRVRHRSHKAAVRKNAKRAGLCQQSSQFAATVIMGNQVRHVCLDKPAGEEAKVSSGPMKVEVINGSATDTQYFSEANQETARNQPVVVGVQSSDTRYAGGNKNPVVTGVVSSSSVDAKSASSGGQPVTKQVSPRPRRPQYEPDAH